MFVWASFMTPTHIHIHIHNRTLPSGKNCTLISLKEGTHNEIHKQACNSNHNNNNSDNYKKSNNKFPKPSLRSDATRYFLCSLTLTMPFALILTHSHSHSLAGVRSFDFLLSANRVYVLFAFVFCYL